MAARQDEFSVVGMCEALGVSSSGYYDWFRRQQEGPTERQAHREKLKERITHFFHTRLGMYGAPPRIWRDLLEDGCEVTERMVSRLMAELGLRACPPAKYLATTDSDHSSPVYPNLLRQDFETDQPNKVWVSDMTYIWTGEGWLYLSAVMDLFGRKLVGWGTTDHLRTEGPLAALEMAILFRQPGEGLIHHSDRDSQYASKDYVAALQGIQAKISMSRKGNPYDNACIESFFASLKKEIVYRWDFKTKAEAIQRINWYISEFYNPVRRHSHNGYLSPDRFEQNHEIVQKSANRPIQILYQCPSQLVDVP
ncbi:IS3 family transposase [Jeotgalibaca sp. A127]|uniref:IS3 family transposase n=1 Tax=Jeotgalibaca sp. A127 TaxID=3457324 RepID=UPI003FD3F0C3